MENQQDVTDTIAVMEKYNFDEPMNVSIIYDDQEEEPYHHPHRGEFVLINKIVDILVSLKKALVHYCDVITRCHDEKRKDRLKAHWLCIKQKSFNECVALSKEFLSLHGVTDRFITDILSSIEQIAKVPITYNIVSNIHETLSKWLELKQFQMTHMLSDLNKNDSTLAQPLHSYAHFSSGNVIDNMPATNIIPCGSPRNQLTLGTDSRIPIQCRHDSNIVNSTIPSISYIQEGVGTHRIPYSNHCFNVINDQQIAVPNAPTLSSAICYIEPEINIPERVCYNDTQINNNNVMLTQRNQTNSYDVTRNSISRDSGFMSPVTSVSPSEYDYRTVQHPFALYEQHIPNFQMPSMPTIELHMINYARPM